MRLGRPTVTGLPGLPPGTAELSRFLTRRFPRIFMYHRFGTETTHRALGVSAFEQQVGYLKSLFTLVTVRDLADRLRRGLSVSGFAAITVDDGYDDFYVHAYPVLKMHGVPATVYVITDFVDGHIWLWPDQLAFILETASGPAVRPGIDLLESAYDLSSPAARQKAWSEIADACLRLHPSVRDRWLTRLGSVLGVQIPRQPPSWCMSLSWDQIRELADNGIEVGSHTRTHPRLSTLAADELENEIRGSKERIERALGRRVESFCYPHGMETDVTPEACREVERAGYSSGVVAHLNRRNAFALYRLGRMSVGKDMSRFVRSAAGFTLLPRFLAK